MASSSELDPSVTRTDPVSISIVFEEAPSNWQLESNAEASEPTREAVEQLQDTITAVCSDRKSQDHGNDVRTRVLPLPFKHPRRDRPHRKLERRRRNQMTAIVNPAGAEPHGTGLDNEIFATEAAAAIFNYRGALVEEYPSKPEYDSALEAIYITDDGEAKVWRRVFFPASPAQFIVSIFDKRARQLFGMTAVKPASVAEVDLALTNLTASIVSEK